MEHTDTRTLILDTAQAMMQTKGYTAVSFRDIAAAVQIKPASIHYYFPSKEQLGKALIERYRGFFESARQSIDAAGAPPMKSLERYVDALREGFRQTGRMCLCGVLAAEASALPPELASEVREFFAENEKWLARVLAAGRRAGELQLQGSAEKNASAFFAGLEGALMAAWIFHDEARLSFTAQWLLESFKIQA